jgi:acyl-CoA synthetase (NDP forming)
VSLARLIRPRSVAVVGASADARKTAGRPVAYLQKHGFTGAIYPVNPRADAIGVLPCYPDVSSLPEAPDVGIVLLGPQGAEAALRELAARGTGAAIVLGGGFAETGGDGERRQQALVAAAGGMRLLGPNTIGLVNLVDRITLSASGALELENLPVGRIAVVSQSGGILGSLLSRAAARGIGFSRLVATGNEADLEIADFVDFLAQDEATSVIALYIESLRRPREFLRAAARAREAGKEIVAFKVGRSAAGAAAAASHTGALAGTDRMYDAFFRRAGVLRASTFAGLLDIPAALAAGRRLRGRRIAILTSTGGAGTLVADSLGTAGFEAPAPDAETAAALRSLQALDQAVLDRNPIDVTLAGLQPALLRGALRALLASRSYDALVVVVGSSALAMPDLMADAIHESLPGSDKPLLAYVSPHAPAVAGALALRGVPALAAPEACAAVLAAMLESSRAEAAAATHGAMQGGQMAIEPATLRRGSLDEHAAKQLFARAGITPTREVVVHDAAGAADAARRFGAPVVLKLLSGSVTHKSEAGGVAVGVAPHDVEARIGAMAAAVAAATGETPHAWLVQERVTGGVEMILGLHRDPLGTAVLLGMGGVTAELFDDTVLRLLPGDAGAGPNGKQANGHAGNRQSGLTREEALEMARSLMTWPLLDGYRGRPKADVAALVDAIVAFSRLAAALGDRLVTAEINPLFVLDAGKGVRAADAVAVLA